LWYISYPDIKEWRKSLISPFDKNSSTIAIYTHDHMEAAEVMDHLPTYWLTEYHSIEPHNVGVYKPSIDVRNSRLFFPLSGLKVLS
jgi:hypothetical protein